MSVQDRIAEIKAITMEENLDLIKIEMNPRVYEQLKQELKKTIKLIGEIRTYCGLPIELKTDVEGIRIIAKRKTIESQSL